MYLAWFCPIVYQLHYHGSISHLVPQLDRAESCIRVGEIILAMHMSIFTPAFHSLVNISEKYPDNQSLAKTLIITPQLFLIN